MEYVVLVINFLEVIYLSNFKQSYLSNGIQAVSVNGKMSSFKPITCGVSQGSILGPLLFLIYIYDLPNALLNQPRIYADDTCLLISSPNIEDLNVKSKTN